MPNSDDSYDGGSLASPYRRNQMSSNEQWIFGAVFAGLLMVGFAFGLYAGAPPAKPKPTETAEAKKDKDGDKPAAKPAEKPADKPANVTPTPEPKKEPDKPKEPEAEPKKTEPEPKKTEPEPKKTEPEPKKTEPKKTEPEPKKVDVPAVAFKEVEKVMRGFCFDCHGAAGKPKGGIDLRTIAAIKKGGNNGDILVAGEPMKSTLYTSLLPTATEKMPPDGKPQPSEKDIKLIHDWIAGGAKPRRTVRRRKSSPVCRAV